CNSGHFNVELNLPGLAEMAVGEPRRVRPFVEEYKLADGRRVFVLADGRLVNLAAAEGHPSAVMDMSFANQALSAEYMLSHSDDLEHTVYAVPEEIDHAIAELKLDSMGVKIDVLTEEQKHYLASWQEGT
ncbi:MAG: adenosylhomocysteinase, partial [Anaerolineae bacterium]|nr:adenosylhomocysteinase [Anaerolineae bacterium]